MTTKIYKSDALAAVHDLIEGFHQSGVVGKTTMRDFDADCLEALPALTAEDIRAIRQGEAVSQPVFARYLNVSKNLVSDWERGVKRPGGPALRLLAIIKKGGLAAIL